MLQFSFALLIIVVLKVLLAYFILKVIIVFSLQLIFVLAIGLQLPIELFVRLGLAQSLIGSQLQKHSK